MNILGWCSSLCGGSNRREYRPRRRIRANALLDNDEFVLEERIVVDEDEVLRAARTAERRQLAIPLRDERLIARLNHSLSHDSSENIGAEIFINALELLEAKSVKAVAIEGVWNSTRHRWRKREAPRLNLLFQTAIQTSLSKLSRAELKNILSDLPPAVMGDAEAQESSRVLIDVSRDVREEMLRRRACLSLTERTQADSTVAAFDAQFKELEKIGLEESDNAKHERNIEIYFEALLTMLKQIPEFDRFRIIMSQLILSKQIPADTTERNDVLDALFIETSGMDSSLEAETTLSDSSGDEMFIEKL